ncbi:hypothetical protein RFI_14659 [Reticulomyxa filosa]|uniref:Uncharacterized protein n=1 Tax=Reticulomyxa filosa TaxID=46433 RepID=X6N9W6_RETFI|nr:hypothetical protein RFI_14659 [Reticulomyxa filosa]|eukprot:ETO22539.1 hypothetical protein RFI_14659 [Reticulomyxa filosa]
MLLFCQNTGLSIEFDEQINCFAFHRLSVAKDIELFNNYAYVCFNGIALFFSGWDDISKKATDAVHKYSIAGDTQITLKHKLPFPLYLQTNLLRVKKIVRSPIVKMTGREREGVAENAEGAGEKEREENEKEDIAKEKEKKKKEMVDMNGENKFNIIEVFERQLRLNFGFITSDDVDTIYLTIDSYLMFQSLGYVTNETYLLEFGGKLKKVEAEEDPFFFPMYVIHVFFSPFQNYNKFLREKKKIIANLIIDGKKVLMKMKELTFGELLRQCCFYFENKDNEDLVKLKLKLQSILDVLVGSVVSKKQKNPKMCFMSIITFVCNGYDVFSEVNTRFILYILRL